MPELHTLALFSAAVLGLLLAPGPNMAFLFAHGLAHGPRAGVAAATGIFIADLLLSALTAAGFTVLLMALPGSFDALRIAGAIYLVWLAIQSFRAKRLTDKSPRVDARMWPVVRRATLNSLLNPKALLFFLVFLPQFVNPASGAIPAQLAVLGLILSVEAFAFHALLGFASGKAAGRMAQSRAVLVLGRIQGVVFVALAVRLLLMERPAAS